jgi:hypothetical protein
VIPNTRKSEKPKIKVDPKMFLYCEHYFDSHFIPSLVWFGDRSKDVWYHNPIVRDAGGSRGSL